MADDPLATPIAEALRNQGEEPWQRHGSEHDFDSACVVCRGDPDVIAEVAAKAVRESPWQRIVDAATALARADVQAFPSAIEAGDPTVDLEALHSELVAAVRDAEPTDED